MNMVLTNGTVPMNGALAPVTGMVGGVPPAGGLLNGGLPSPLQAQIPGMTAQLPTQFPGAAQFPGQTMLPPMLGMPNATNPLQRQILSPG